MQLGKVIAGCVPRRPSVFERTARATCRIVAQNQKPAMRLDAEFSLARVIILSALVLQGCSYTIPIKEGEPTAQITFTALRGLELKPLVQMPVKIKG